MSSCNWCLGKQFSLSFYFSRRGGENDLNHRGLKSDAD